MKQILWNSIYVNNIVAVKRYISENVVLNKLTKISKYKPEKHLVKKSFQKGLVII